MAFELKITFGKSSSQYYKKALKYAGVFTGFLPISEDNPANVVVVDGEELKRKSKKFEALWYVINNWKTTELMVNGEYKNVYEIREYLEILECSKGFARAVLPSKYCNLYGDKEGWGCKFLKTISRYPRENYYQYGDWSNWYDFGRFASETVWKVDKSKLLETLRREASLKNLELCDVFEFNKAEAIVDSLQGEIDVEKSEYWEIEFEEMLDGAIIEKKPIRIKPKEERLGYGVEFGVGLTALNETEEEKKEDKRRRYIPELSFEDIGGIEDIIETIREVIELPLKAPGLFEYLGIKPHKGILLYGPPGCGKTMIAKAIANEIEAHFISIKGPELINKYWGESEAQLRAVFEEAREKQPSIIYFDEFDSVTHTRSDEGTLRFEAQFVNQLLTLMDGVEDYGNVCVIGSTNRIELIDEALLRPGRFDYTLEVKKPTNEGCYDIFYLTTKDMPVSKKFDKKAFSEKLHGLSGAEINFVAREGAYNCVRRMLDLKDVLNDEIIRRMDFSKLEIIEDDFLLALEEVN